MSTPTPTIKITYYDRPGRAEMLRLALLLSDTPFTDERLTESEWEQLRPSTPYRTIPLLTIDGRVYAQSEAILRYIGQIGDLYPADPREALKVDEILGVIDDLATAIMSARASDEDMHAASERIFERFFGGAERRVREWGAEKWVLDRVSVADLSVFCTFGYLCVQMGVGERLRGFERLWRIYEEVGKIDKVREWYKGKEGAYV